MVYLSVDEEHWLWSFLESGSSSCQGENTALDPGCQSQDPAQSTRSSLPLAELQKQRRSRAGAGVRSRTQGGILGRTWSVQRG